MENGKTCTYLLEQDKLYEKKNTYFNNIKTVITGH